MIADHDALAHHRRSHDGCFHLAWGDVLAACGDDEILLTPDDGNEAVIINGAEITGMQPSIDNLLLGNVRIVVVSGAYGRALYAQLPFFVDPMVTPCRGKPMVPIL